MGRNKKEGLDYFPFEVDFFTDIKVRKLIKYQGGKAVTVYALLLCFIYKSGYYLRWDQELPFIVSEQTGFEEVYILEVIKSCLTLGLFSKELYESNQILTSKGIQDRYIYICNISKRKVVISPEFNISSEKMCISSEEIGISSEEMPINSEKSTQSKVKESKKEKELSNDNSQKESPKTVSKPASKVDLSFVAPEYLEIFTEWLEYKKARRETYKTAMSLKKCYSHMLNLAGNDIQTAKLIVEQSIACNYAGMFELKQQFKPQAKKNPNLGIGEFINQQGQRTYGSGKYIIPDDAPPRPGDKYFWNASTKQWLV